MYTVEIRSSCIILHNYEMGDNERLERALSIWDKARHRFIPMARYYDAENKDLYVCRGLDLWMIIPSFARNIVSHTEPNGYDNVGQILLKTQPRDERQAEAIKFCLGMDQYHMNRHLPQLCLNLTVGAGKTFLAIFCFAFYCIKTMVITSSVSWLEQWKEKIIEYTNLRSDEIYIIAGAPSITKLVKGIHKPNNIKFYLCTHSTLYSYGKTKGWDKLSELFQFLRVGIKIYDEAHLYFENICRIDFFSNVWKTYYLTATPLKSDFYQNIVYQKCFSTVPKISLFDEVNDPHTSYLAILFNSHPSAFELDKCCNSTQYGFSIMEYVSYFETKDIYFKLLRIVLAHCLTSMSNEDKILIYIGKNSTVLNTYYWLRYNYYGIPIGIYTSLIKENKKDQLENTIILTTTKSASALLDIPRLKKVIIFAEPFNSAVLARQILGRTRDKDTELIELVDCGFQRIKDWYMNKRRNVYSIYATEMNEISYTDSEITTAIYQLDKQERERLEANKINRRQVVDINK